MPRNAEKDLREESRRRAQILEAGLALFSAQGIESVSMNAVAAAAGVGPTTLFKYYQTKEKLVVAIISAAWSREWALAAERCGMEKLMNFTAYEMIRYYTDWMISLYLRQPELLRFSENYKTFICRQRTQTKELQEHLNPLQPIQAAFHAAYLHAQEDRSIRTDVSEDVLFSVVAIGMLSMAERYAQGVVWASRSNADYTEELRIVQEMTLHWCKAEGEHCRRRTSRSLSNEKEV